MIRTFCQLLFFFLLFSGSFLETVAQNRYIFTETFIDGSGGTPPSRWESVALPGDASEAGWRFDNPMGRTLSFPMVPPLAIFDAGFLDSGTGDAEIALQRQSFELRPDWTNNYMLIFDHALHIDASVVVKVEVYDGTNWLEAKSWTGLTIALQREIVDISDLLGATSGQIRFTWSGSVDGDGYWAIDNVRVFAAWEQDAGLVQISSPVMPMDEDVHDLEVVIGNFGIQPVSSATIRWNLDGGAEQGFDWEDTGNPLLFGQSRQIPLGTVNITEPVMLNIWLDLPGDENPDNDAISVKLRPRMSGDYTIGGANPDFPTFGEAVQALSLAGIAGPVTFHVAEGDYEERVDIGPIDGVSATNTISFLSAPPNTSLPSLFTSIEEQAALQIRGASHLRFEGIGFSGHRGVVVEDHAADVTFLDCQFSATEVGLLIRGGANDVLVEGGDFRDAALLLGVGEAGMAMVHGIRILGNEFYDAQVRAIHVHDASGVEIGYNVIDNVKFGLSAEGGSDLSIRNNHIHVEARFGFENAGIRLDDITGARVFNNFISSQGMAIATGIRLVQTRNAGIYFNSVNIINTDVTADSKALRIDEGNQGLDVRNNIFNIEEQGYPVYMDVLPGDLTLNHNNYYHPQGRIGWFQNAVQNSLADWQSATGQDARSLAVKPFFASLTSPEIGQSLLFGAAEDSLLPPINDDIDDEPRTGPTIGAREFEACPNDAGINDITSPESPVTGSYPIIVVLHNHGTQELQSVDIYWRINDMDFGPYAWKAIDDSLGNIAPFESRNVTITPNQAFSNGMFFRLQVWTENPNGSGPNGDCDESNDFYHQDYTGALCGTYTIGGDGSVHPNFESFSDAVEVLNLAGTACEEVIFIVYPKSGDYDEQIMLIDFPASTPIDSVIFQSADVNNPARIFYVEHQQSPVRIRGARNIHFRDISFRGHTPMLIENHADNLSFEGCRFEVFDQTGSSSTQGVRITNHARNIVFSGNVFQDGYHSINIPPGQGAGVGHIEITNNDFQSPFHDAIQTHGANHMLIHNNRFYNIRLGILSGGTNNLTISNNRFYIETDPGQDNINRGVFVSGGNTIRIFNNFIWSTGLGATTGIRIRNTTNCEVFFNSINIANNNLQGVNQGLLIDGGNHVDVLNNIARIHVNGYPVWLEGTPILLTLDHNNYFHTDGMIGYDGSGHTSMDTWQLATGQDPNSLSVNPFFTDSEGPDISQSKLANAGMEAGGITNDIAGQARGNPPTIGAREYIPETIDAGIAGFVSPGTQVLGEETITVILQNHGTANLESVTIQWEVNGEDQGSIPWPTNGASLSYQDTIHEELGSYLFQSGSYVIRAWTSDPNQDDDGNLANDSSELIVYGGLAGDYEVGPGRDFEDVSHAVAALNQAGITGDVRFLIAEDHEGSLLIGDFGRAADDLTVTFIADKPDGSLVQISPSAGMPFAMKLEGTKHLHFEGIDFRAPTTVIIDPGSSDIRFDDCRFTATDKQAVVIGAGSSDIAFLNGGFSGGDHSILLDGQTAAPIERVLIEDNQFNSTSGQAIDANWANDITIRDNHFEDVRSGIRVTNSESLLIRENWIAMQASASLTKGIEVVGSSEVRIYNNFVFGTGHGAVWGMDMKNNEQAYIYFNTVNITSSSALSRALILDEGHTIYVSYNIFSTRTGYPLYIGQLPLDIALRSNNYHNQSGSQVVYYNQTYLFLAWRDFALNQGIDDQSENIDPEFDPEDSPIPGNEDLRNLAERMDDIRYDIRGARRHPDRPDIGCYELFFDFGVAEIILPEIDCTTNEIDGFYVRLIYSGLEATDFETPLRVNYQLDADPVGSEDFHLSEEEDEVVVYIPYDIDLRSPGMYELRVWLPDVAAMNDEYDGNDSLSVSWAKHPAPDITSIGFNPACEIIRFYADVVPDANDPIVSTIWSFGDGSPEADVYTPEHRFDAAGTYQVVFQVTTQSGCVVEEVLDLQVGDPEAELEVTAQISQACGGGSSGEIFLTVSGGMAPYRATLDGDVWVDEDEEGSGVFSFTGLAPGNYTVEVLDQMNCAAITDLEVLPVPAVNPVINAPDHVYIPASVPFGFTSDHTGYGHVVWSLNGETSNDAEPDFFFDTVGTYTVTLEVFSGPSNQCQERVVHIIEAELMPLTLEVEVSQQYCQADDPPAITLLVDGGVPPYRIFVDGNEEDVTTDMPWILPDPLPGQSYAIMVMDEYDQQQTSQVDLAMPVAMNPVIVLTNAEGISFYDAYIEVLPFDVTFSMEYDDEPESRIWRVGTRSATTAEAVFGFDTPGEFLVELETTSSEPGACVEVAYFMVVVELRVEIATVDIVTPNDDGVDDYFEVIHKGLVSLEVDIFDRRGRQVYRIDELDGRWNGDFDNGQAAPDGMYPYYLRAMGYDGLPYERTGMIQLIRDAILVYPNPAAEMVTIDPMGNLAGRVEIDVVDLRGHTALSLKNLEFTSFIELDISALQEGIYLIRITDQRNVFHSKLLIRRQ